MLLVDTVSVEEPAPGKEAGANEDVAPVGKPFTLNEISPGTPLVGVIVAVNVVLPP